MKLLLPLDGTPLSESTLPFGVSLAQRWNAEVLLVRACDPSLSVAPELPAKIRSQMLQRSLAAAGEYLEHLHGRFPGLTVHDHTPSGRAREEIPRLAQSENCDLIVLAFHGRSGPDRWLLGSVAEGVLRRSPCPVLLLHPPAAEVSQFSHVLIPIDGSEDSLLVVERLGPFLAPDARLTLFQSSGLDPDLLETSPESDLTSQCLVTLAESLQQVKIEGRAPEVVVVHGPPAQAILDWAGENHCDLIAMSTHGRTGDRSLWLGSVTEKVARSSPCPVLACPGGR